MAASGQHMMVKEYATCVHTEHAQNKAEAHKCTLISTGNLLYT